MIRVFLLTAWCLLALGATAHAGPVIGAIGAIASAIAASPLLQLVLGVVVKVGIGLINKARQKKQKEPGMQAEVRFGGDNPLSFIMGSFATAGVLENVYYWGEADKTPNAYLTHVLSLGDLPMALTGLWVDDKKVTLPTMTGSPPTDQGWPIAEFNADGQDYLWIKFLDGTQTAADSWLLAKFGSHAERPWLSDMIGRGVPIAILTARTNSKLFSGIPGYLFETSGIRLYDPRKDSTVGGSGSHRWSDWSTWEPSSNPMVQVYNLIRGIRFGTEWVYGGQTTQAWQLPTANLIAAMNACEESIALAAGGYEFRYRSGCEVETDQEPLEVIESLLKGCSGRMSAGAGIYKFLVGTPGAAVYSFGDEQIVITEGQSLDPFPGLEETFNGARATYPEPGERWGSKEAPAYYRSDLEVLDDNRRLVTGLSYPTVPYAVQVQRLLKEAIEDSRRFRVHQFYLPPDANLLEPNDVVAWTSDRNSYSSKKFVVVDIEGGSNFLQLVTLKEVDPADYSWNPLADERPYSVGPLGGAATPPTQQMTGWQVFPAELEDNSGTGRRPTILVTYDGKLDDVASVQVQVKLAGAADTNLSFDGTLTYGDPATNPNPASVKLNGVFIGATAYEARGKYLPKSARSTDWSGWLPVTTPNTRFGGDDLYPISIDQLNADLTKYLEWIGDGTRQLIDQLMTTIDAITSQDLANYADKQTLRQEVVSTAENVTAAYRDEIIAATGPGSALVARISTLEVTVPGLATLSALNALVTRVDTLDGEIDAQATAITALQIDMAGKASVAAVNALDTRVTTAEGQITATSNSLTSLTATVGGIESNVTVRGTAMGSSGDGYARWGVQVKTGSGSTWSTAAFFLDTAPGVSRVTFQASQFVITDGVNVEAPFLFYQGVLYLTEAYVTKLAAYSIDAANLFLNGVVITEALGLNAATLVNSAVAFDTYTLNNTVPQGYTVLTVAMNGLDASTLVTIMADILFTGIAASSVINVHIKRNGTSVRTDTYTAGEYGQKILNCVDYPGAGNHTYTLYVEKTAGTGGDSWNRRFMTCTASKR